MIEKGKISAFQMASLVYLWVLATAVLTIPGITAKFAERDMWLSPIFGSLIGFLTVFIMCKLHKYYPNQTIIQYSERILGKIPGKAMGFIFLFLIFHSDILIVRDYGEFIATAFLTKTPLMVIMGSLVLICAFTVRSGLEAVGRTANVILPFYIFLLVLIMVLLIQDMYPKHMFPMMENGLLPPLMGAALPQTWFSQSFLISMLLPFLTDPEKGMKWGMFSILAITLTLMATNLTILFLYGAKTTADITYPLMSAARHISIAHFFEHLEAIVMAIWVTGIFIKLSLFYYVLVLGVAQWLNLSDYKQLVLPFGFISAVGGLWAAPSLQDMNHFLTNIYPFYGTLISTVFPGLMLLVAVIRKKLKGADEDSTLADNRT